MKNSIVSGLIGLLAAIDPGMSSASEAKAPVGIAEMMPDRSIVLLLRTRADDGTIGETRLVYAADGEGYAELIEHLGGLEPSQSKPVPPWPEAAKP